MPTALEKVTRRECLRNNRIRTPDRFVNAPLSANKRETREQKKVRVGRGRELTDGERRRNGVERSAPLFWGGEAKPGSFPGEPRGFGEGEAAAVHGG